MFNKKAILAIARKLAVLAVAGVASWVASPAVLGLIPTEYGFIFTAVIAPLLWKLDEAIGGSKPPVPTPPAA